MNRIRMTWVIVLNALVLMRKRKLLLLFPLLQVVAILAIVALFVSPMLLGVSSIESGRGPENDLGTEAFEVLNEQSFQALLLLAALYLVSVFVATFINVAFYNEILSALNCRDISVARGFRVATSKIRAILSWSLLAGTVGLVIRLIQERLGRLGQWLFGALGISWSVASVFVLPVIIREDRQRSPWEYLHTSARLIKRTWGEGVIGFAGIALVGFAVLICSMFIVTRVVLWIDSLGAAVVGVLVIAAIIIFFVVAMQIFRCSLYVYATEGVAPGEFDEAFFDRAWKTKRP